jgi:hypothetical protein
MESKCGRVRANDGKEKQLMSVVTSDSYIDGHYNGVDDLKDTCSLCERKLGYPHVAWPSNGVFICEDCCSFLRDQRFIADLIEVEAIRKLRDLGYRGLTVTKMPGNAEQVRHEPTRS